MSETTSNPDPTASVPSPVPEPAPELASAADPAADATAAEAATEAAAGPATEPAAGSAEARPAPIPDLSPAACAAALAQHFPALFGAGRMPPIKLRIQADIQQRVPGVFSKKSLSIFLHRHTTSTAYIKALVNSQHRFDLDGQPAGEIAQEHKDAGVAELERRLAIVMARRAAEREAQRQARRPGAAAAAASGDAAPAAEVAAPPQRAPRAERPEHAPRHPRPPRPDAAPHGERAPRPDGSERPVHADRPPRPDRARPAPRPASASGGSAEHGAPVAGSVAVAAPAAPSVPLTPEQVAENEARRARAALLRAFETTTLTRSNFCALKGLKDEVLEAQLVQAREERKLHPPAASDRERSRDDRPRFEDRGPRRKAPPARPGAGRGGRPPR